MDGVANRADEWKIFKSITFSHEADSAMTQPRIWWLFVSRVTRLLTDNDKALSMTF
jgi:hypothetical protein